MDKVLIVKAVTHIHSEWSYDGHMTITRIVKLFDKLGYDIVLTAEHDRTFDNNRWENYKNSCCEASTKRTLIVPGIEYSDANNAVHILVWGVSEFLGKGQETGHLLQKANEKNGICVLAHPGRRDAWQQLAKSWVPFLHGIEIWNRKFDGIVPSQNAIDLLRTYSTVTPFAGLDLHQINQLFPLSMMLEINGDLSVENVLSALRSSTCHPLAFGFSTSYFTNGFLFSFAKIVDSIRRKISNIIKR